MLDPDVQLTTLPNGIRVVTEHVPYLNSVALGLWVGAGARHESDEQAGISHLLEHMLFKGTPTRNARQIAEELDAVGGQIDAYTSKEYTAFSARMLPEHASLTLDVLADMLRNSVLDERELALEKSVVLEEFRSLEDSPEEFIHDLFFRAVWPKHPLGRPIIGTPAVVESLNRDDLVVFLDQHYFGRNMIFGAAGQVRHEDLVLAIEERFGDLPAGEVNGVRQPADFSDAQELISRPTEQVHFCMGLRGVEEDHPDRWALRILNLVFGGGMSSRLFQEVREKRGLCYSIGSDTLSYREAGLFMIYADTSPDQVDTVRALTEQELARVAEEGLSADELRRAKDQVRAATLLSLDDVTTRMSRLGRGLMYHGRVIPPSEVLRIVDRLDVDDCRRVAASLFTGGCAFAAVGPFNGKRRKSSRRK
jgi:predicted Zn-dependent peptidase